MGLTQVSTDGVKNDAITKTKIPANQIEASELADNAVDTNAIANNAVTAGKLASGVQTTINNNADNRVITGSGTANTLEGESNIIVDNSRLQIGGNSLSNISSFADDLVLGQSGSTAINGLTFCSTNSSGIRFHDTGDVGEVEFNHSDNSLTVSADGLIKVRTNSAERMRIDSSGKLSTGGESAPDVSAGGLCLNQGTGDEKILTFKSSDIAHGVTTFDETDTFFSARKSSSNKGGVRLHGFTDAAGADPAFEFHGIIASDSDASYVPFEFRGHEANGTGTQNIAADRRIAKFTNSDGTIIAGVTGTGITFGNDTAAANALDDYEEGTWTPVYLNVNTPTYGHRSGRYTKIGRFVYLVCQISVDSGLDTSDGSGINIGGLPFTGNNAHGSALFTLGRYNTILTDSKIQSFCNVRFNGNGIMLQEGRSGDADISYSECNSSGHLQFAMSYAL